MDWEQLAFYFIVGEGVMLSATLTTLIVLKIIEIIDRIKRK